MRTIFLLLSLPALLSLSWDTKPDHWGIGVLAPRLDTPALEGWYPAYLPSGLAIPYYEAPLFYDTPTGSN